MRNFQPCFAGETQDAPGQQSQARMLAILFTGFEQRLHPYANSQNWIPAPVRLAQDLFEATSL